MCEYINVPNVYAKNKFLDFKMDKKAFKDISNVQICS